MLAYACSKIADTEAPESSNALNDKLKIEIGILGRLSSQDSFTSDENTR